MFFCKDRINPDYFLIFLVKKHSHSLRQRIFWLWLFCLPKVMSVCRFLPSFNTSSYCFLLILFAPFRAQNFIIKQKVRENRNILGLLYLRLIFLFLLYGICVTKQRIFTFKLLVACLRPVTRPLFTQKWATFYA